MKTSLSLVSFVVILSFWKYPLTSIIRVEVVFGGGHSLGDQKPSVIDL